MSEQNRKIELRSDEIQDILGKVPPLVVRRGMAGIFIVISILIALAAWFKYPDRIASQIQLTSDNPPVYLVSRVTAKIAEFFVVENQEVNVGDLLIVLESGANYREVLEVRSLVEALPTSPDGYDADLFMGIHEMKDLELGNLQGEFAGLQKSVQALQDFLRFDKYQMRIEGKEKEIRDYRIHYDRLYSQKLNKEEELKIAENQYKRKKGLHSDGTISDVELEEAEQKYLTQKNQVEEARLLMSSAAMDIGKLNQSLDELKISRQEDELNAYSQMQENKDKFLGAMTDWEQKYLLIAPAHGRISLSKFWSVNQEVKQDTRILAIVQENSGPLLGKLVLPNQGAGKVKEGQTVIIKFDRYPHMEFGMVTGIVNSISLVPEEANYYVEVGFPDGLTTSYNRELEFSQEMTGQAEIITEVRSFLVRIVSPLKSLINRNSINEKRSQLTK